MPALALAFGILVIASFTLPLTARADDLAEFEIARRTYDAHEYAQAVIYFEALVGGEVPRLSSPSLVLEARKYLGATYVFEGRRDAAREQFELLLRAEPSYEMDPLRFPVEVIEIFEATRERVQFEREQEEARATLIVERDVERARADALLALADRPVEAMVEHSRWLALLPFGIGQFQNGDEGAGWGFLLSEAAFVLIGAGGLIWYFDVDQQYRAATDRMIEEGNPIYDTLRDLALGAQVINLIGMSAAGLLAIIGIVEAQVNFVSGHPVPARIDIPPELRGTPDEEELEAMPAPDRDPELSLGVGGLRLSF